MREKGCLAADRLLTVLKPTRQSRDGLPVLALHHDVEPVWDVLCRGFCGRLLNLYAMVQRCLHAGGGPPPEPAHLLLSGSDGGFARSGFFLSGDEKPRNHYVDLKEGSPLAGRFGAMDQIFPHELAHVIQDQLAGEPPAGGSNQVHATSLRTDPVLAFTEGFAEHMQAMAVDDPDAHPATAALARDLSAEQRMDQHLERYRIEAGADPWPEDGLIRTFLRWFPKVEQAERYFAVKQNRYAYDPPLPRGVLREGGDPYGAYLIESIVPGRPGGVLRAPARAFSTEGFVSTFFVRLVGSGDKVAPLENAYRKIFHAIRAERLSRPEPRFSTSTAACPGRTRLTSTRRRSSTFSGYGGSTSHWAGRYLPAPPTLVWPGCAEFRG